VKTSAWYQELAAISSLGSRQAKATSLAGLHEAREKHLGQFFTPPEVAAFMWRLVEPAIAAAVKESKGCPVALFDNSIGTARLFQFASPEQVTIAGLDVHVPSVEAVTAVLEKAGFSADIIAAGMEEVHPQGFGVCLINPPFSLQLESPHLLPLECCSFGKFGPATNCLSHIYAVGQALEAGDVVAAILPTPFADSLLTDPFFRARLRGVFRLPADAFSSEGTNVSTSIAVWGPDENTGDVLVQRVADLSSAVVPTLDLLCRSINHSRPKSLSRVTVDLSSPTIKTPVTGIRRVRVCRHNRRLILKFECGLTEAKVLNAIYRDRVDGYVEEHRYPRGVRFKGQGVLDLEIHLLQADPCASFADLEAAIRDAGGEPVVDPGIHGYLRRMTRKLARHRVPFAHTIRVKGLAAAGDEARFTARKTFLLNPRKWGSPVVRKGQECAGRRAGPGRWTVQAAEADWPMTDEEVAERFEHVVAVGTATDAWTEKFPGRLKSFPALARQMRQRARLLGLDKFLTWGFQFDDVCEIAVSPLSACFGAEMGLGKTRIAAALFLLHGSKRNLYATEAHLVPEVIGELRAIGFSEADWRVIDSPEALLDLRRINVISYARLRLPVHRERKKFTYAKALRRRCGCVVADEGHLLRNLHSEQTRAMWALACPKRYVFTGTLIANYPRDTLNILAWVGGSATAAQPYGIRQDAFLEPRLISSMSKTARGIDAYVADFVSIEWATHAFREDLAGGAKREVPKVANLPLFRSWLAPWVKRRLAHEPDVAKYITIPRPENLTMEVDWSDEHLGFYLKVADDFSAFYREAKRRAGEGNLNLISLLVRIGAVETACNFPQQGVDGFGALGGLTSKQTHALRRLEELVEEGHKVILYAKSPGLLELLAKHLTATGIESVLLHGGRSIEERTKDLNERFRFGGAPVLLASYGVAQAGLNLPQASRIVLISRTWEAKTERQAVARVLRPQQKRNVVIERIHLPGAIDVYQDQCVRWKADAADAGLDWATPETDGEEFAHLDHILGQFVKDLAELRGLDPALFREAVKRRRAA